MKNILWKIKFSLWKISMFQWTEYRINMVLTIMWLVLGTCQIPPNNGMLTGEVRVINEDGTLGEYLGGA